LAWWAGVSLLGHAVAPLVERLFPRFPDRGLPFSRPLALISVTYASWIAGSFGAPPRAALLASIVLLVFAWAIARRFSSDAASTRDRLFDEATFFAALLAFAALRGLQPAISGAEKYMDFAFFNACLRAESFPPGDPWLAGAPINYYYFGYLLFANVAQLTRVPPEIAYNLSIATVGAMVFTGAVSIGRVLAGSLRAGLLSGLAVAVLGNLDGFLQLVVERKGLAGFDYWRSSRVVPDTINEFPFFSLLHGDLHPHVSALVVLLPLIATGAAAWQDGAAGSPRVYLLRPLRFAVAAILLGCLSLTNPWDLPVMLTFLGIVSLSRVWRRERPWRAVAAIAGGLVLLVVLASIVSLPFTSHFDAPLRGIGRVHAKTDLLPFLTVFGLLLSAPIVFLVRRAESWMPSEPEPRDLVLAAGAFTVVVAYLVTTNWVMLLTLGIVLAGAVRIEADPRGQDALPLAFFVTAAIALFTCEIVFLRDAYGEALHRMNTVFKLYFQAWIFLSIALPFFVSRVLRGLAGRSILQPLAAAILVTGIAASLCYPVAAVAMRWRGIAAVSLDGNDYLDREHPDDAAAIRWMRTEITGLPVVLEATGPPYSYFARVSSNTGLPTLLGWANHEGVWRGNLPVIGDRKDAIDTIYETLDPDAAGKLLREHGVELVFVGELEHERYGREALGKFERRPDLFRLAFRSGATSVYRIERRSRRRTRSRAMRSASG
ncbi:MAG: DUF2298 domain-containing protein, partial [Candidatus Binatia bacterium]